LVQGVSKGKERSTKEKIDMSLKKKGTPEKIDVLVKGSDLEKWRKLIEKASTISEPFTITTNGKNKNKKKDK
jgi:hypothetical protein